MKSVGVLVTAVQGLILIPDIILMWMCIARFVFGSNETGRRNVI